MLATKVQAERGFAEVTLRMPEVDERLLRDIAAYNAVVEAMGAARGPGAYWLARLA